MISTRLLPHRRQHSHTHRTLSLSLFLFFSLGDLRVVLIHDSVCVADARTHARTHAARTSTALSRVRFLWFCLRVPVCCSSLVSHLSLLLEGPASDGRGASGFSASYTAHAGTTRLVPRSFPPKAFSESARRVSRFSRESRATSSIFTTHDNSHVAPRLSAIVRGTVIPGENPWNFRYQCHPPTQCSHLFAVGARVIRGMFTRRQKSFSATSKIPSEFTSINRRGRVPSELALLALPFFSFYFFFSPL